MKTNIQKVLDKNHVVYKGNSFECKIRSNSWLVDDDILVAWKTSRWWIFGELKNKIALELFELFYRTIQNKGERGRLTKPCSCKYRKKLIGVASCGFMLTGGLNWEIRKCLKCGREFSVQTGIY